MKTNKRDSVACGLLVFFSITAMLIYVLYMISLVIRHYQEMKSDPDMALGAVLSYAYFLISAIPVLIAEWGVLYSARAIKRGLQGKFAVVTVWLILLLSYAVLILSTIGALSMYYNGDFGTVSFLLSWIMLLPLAVLAISLAIYNSRTGTDPVS